MATDNARQTSIKISEPKAPLIPNILNMQGDFNLYDSDRNSDDLSSRSESSAYFPAPHRPLSDNTPYTTTDNTPVKPRTNNIVGNDSYANNNATRVNNASVDGRMLFVVDTIREHSDVDSIGLETPKPNNDMSRAPLPSGFTTPSTMSPLFGNSRNPSIEYANTPGLTPRISYDSHNAVVGLNASNENLWRSRFISASDMQSTDWTRQRQLVEESMKERYIEDLTNYIVPKEVEVKRGIFGKIKLTFKLIDSKLEAKISNMDSIAIKYHDRSKRKFFWTIWEKKSGNYESYEDFKRSWDPKTNIWAEIKGRTNNDVRADVEGILGVGRNINQLNSAPNRGIQERNVDVSTGVNQLIRERQPFTYTELPNNEVTTVENQETPRRLNKSHSHSHHKHSNGRRHRHK